MQQLGIATVQHIQMIRVTPIYILSHEPLCFKTSATSDADAPLCAQIHDISQDWLHQAFFQLTSAIDKDELNITFYRMI